jgi:hypothetical protein
MLIFDDMNIENTQIAMFGDVKAVPYSTSMLSVELIHIKHQTKRI